MDNSGQAGPYNPKRARPRECHAGQNDAGCKVRSPRDSQANGAVLCEILAARRRRARLRASLEGNDTWRIRPRWLCFVRVPGGCPRPWSLPKACELGAAHRSELPPCCLSSRSGTIRSECISEMRTLTLSAAFPCLLRDDVPQIRLVPQPAPLTCRRLAWQTFRHEQPSTAHKRVPVSSCPGHLVPRCLGRSLPVSVREARFLSPPCSTTP
jgi:hypothetical protein